MLKTLIRRLIALTMLLPGPLLAAAPIAYRVDWDIRHRRPAMVVEMRFHGNASGQTVLELPSRWAGTDGLERNLEGLRLVGGTLLPGKDAAHRIVRHRPGASLLFRYRVVDRRAVPPGPDYGKADPILRADWITIHTEGAIAYPEGAAAAPARIRFAPAPTGWRIVSDLERIDPARLTVTKIAEGIIVGGRHLRVTERRIGGATLRFAELGRWPFGDARFTDDIVRLMATENATLGEPAIDYLVTLSPLTGSELGAQSSGGSGRSGGFAMLATENVPLGDFTRLIAHEYAHRWFGRGFGINRDGAHAYLFSEGFNDWFAARAMVKSGLWTPADWTKALDLVLLRYGSSTARGLSEAAITARFWSDPDAMQLQYDRGNLTALLLDQRLRTSGGLMPLLRQMTAGGGEERDRIEQLAEAASPGAFAAAAHDALDGLPGGTLAACGTLRWVERPAYGRGFAIDEARRVTSVIKDSGAEVAGIRPGMLYRRRLSFTYLDSTMPYVAAFDDGGTPRTIRWLPTLPHVTRFQQLDAATATPACRASVAGAPGLP